MSILDYDDDGEFGRQSRLSRFYRFAVPLLLGGATTVALLYMMQSLISSSDSIVDVDKGIHMVDFVRVKQAQEVQVKQRKPKKPPPPQELPPQTSKVQFEVAVGDHGFSMSDIEIDGDADLGSSTFGFQSDGNYLPIVKVQPVYPRIALTRGQEGWVVLQFTVDKLGRVVEPEVIDHCAYIRPIGVESECWDQPDRVFDYAAIQAARKFKYKPKVENGVAVATYNVRHKITFELMDDYE